MITSQYCLALEKLVKQILSENSKYLTCFIQVCSLRREMFLVSWRPFPGLRAAGWAETWVWVVPVTMIVQ